MVPVTTATATVSPAPGCPQAQSRYPHSHLHLQQPVCPLWTLPRSIGHYLDGVWSHLACSGSPTPGVHQLCVPSTPRVDTASLLRRQQALGVGSRAHHIRDSGSTVYTSSECTDIFVSSGRTPRVDTAGSYGAFVFNF